MSTFTAPPSFIQTDKVEMQQNLTQQMLFSTYSQINITVGSMLLSCITVSHLFLSLSHFCGNHGSRALQLNVKVSWCFSLYGRAVGSQTVVRMQDFFRAGIAVKRNVTAFTAILEFPAPFEYFSCLLSCVSFKNVSFFASFFHVISRQLMNNCDQE